jgi:hypothetical protein
VKARLLLAEAATSHPDGTFSVLRAGVTNVWGEKPPVNLQASLVTRIDADLGDVDDHRIEIMCMDEDGKEVMLAGDGGDELFGGNARYAKQQVFEWYWRIPQILRRGVIEPSIMRIPLLGSLPSPRSYRRRGIRDPLEHAHGGVASGHAFQAAARDRHRRAARV